jgi:hypothetical protein
MTRVSLEGREDEDKRKDFKAMQCDLAGFSCGRAEEEQTPPPKAIGIYDAGPSHARPLQSHCSPLTPPSHVLLAWRGLKMQGKKITCGTDRMFSEITCGGQ